MLFNPPKIGQLPPSFCSKLTRWVTPWLDANEEDVANAKITRDEVVYVISRLRAFALYKVRHLRGGIFSDVDNGTLIMMFMELHSSGNAFAAPDRISGDVLALVNEEVKRGVRALPNTWDGTRRSVEGLEVELNTVAYALSLILKSRTGITGSKMVGNAYALFVVSLCKRGCISESNWMTRELSTKAISTSTVQYVWEEFLKPTTFAWKKEAIEQMTKSDVIWIKKSATQAADAGMTPLALIRDVQASHPKFPWGTLTEIDVYSQEGLALQKGLEALKAEPLLGFTDDAYKFAVTGFPHIFWLARKIREDIDGDRQFKDYAGKVATPHLQIVERCFSRYIRLVQLIRRSDALKAAQDAAYEKDADADDAAEMSGSTGGGAGGAGGAGGGGTAGGGAFGESSCCAAQQDDFQLRGLAQQEEQEQEQGEQEEEQEEQEQQQEEQEEERLERALAVLHSKMTSS